jgi:hypothetical protein
MRSLLFFLVACGGGSQSTPSTTPLPPATPPPGEPAPAPVASGEKLPDCKPMTSSCAIESLAVFSNQMCGCKDKACAEKVTAEMSSWGEALAKDETMANTKPTQDEARRANEVMTKYAECMTKLMSNDQPGG